MDVLSQAPGVGYDAGVAIGGGRREVMEAAEGMGQGPLAFKSSFKTAIVNRKSAMLLLNQV